MKIKDYINVYMDPQKLSQLDPKLREAYQRVMGTVIPKPQAAPVAQTQSSTPPTPLPTAVLAKTGDLTQTSQPHPIPEPKPSPSPIAPMEPPQPPASEPQPDPSIPQPIAEPQPAINPQPETPPAGEPMPQPAIPAQQTSNFVQMDSKVAADSTISSPNFTTPAPQTQVMALKKKNRITPILFGIVGLIFIAIYTLFWTKIFNFKLPFLP